MFSTVTTSGQASWRLIFADGVLTNDTKIRVTRIDIPIIKLLEEAEVFTGGKGKVGVAG